jgi:hypothetical protein
LKGDENTTRGYRALTSAECTIVMIVMLTITKYLGSSLDLLDDGFGRVLVDLVNLWEQSRVLVAQLF